MWKNMNLFSTSQRILKRAIHLGRLVPEIDPLLEKAIQEENINLKKLRTRRNIGMTRLPPLLQVSAEKRLQIKGSKKLRREAAHLMDVMYNYKLPDDQQTLRSKRHEIRTELELRDKIKERHEHTPEQFYLEENKRVAENELNRLIDGTIEDRRRDWHYYEYDEYSSDLYMATRLAPNYAAIRTVMEEIKLMDTNFDPKSVLDFGSGMGTTIWAINNAWPNANISEFLNVDISKDQQFLCEYLLRGAREIGDPIPNVYHRQYLPGSNKVCYDMVVSAFSMLDLPNIESRINTIENLWHKTNDLLVLIERGNQGGFTIINEARNLLLDLGGHKVTSRIPLTFENRPTPRMVHPDAHVLAPCPHEYHCPRASMPTKKRMNICRFRVAFEPLEIGKKKPPYQHEEFSYLVLRKGHHPSHDTGDFSLAPRWPRIVEPRNKSGGMAQFKICCANGHLAETVISRSRYGKPTYDLAKSCNWGDILPCKVNDTYIKTSEMRERIESGEIKSSQHPID